MRRVAAAALGALIAVTLIVPGLPAGAATKWRVIRNLSVTGAGLWHAARMKVMPGASWEYWSTRNISKMSGGDACVQFVRDQEGWYSAGGGFGFMTGSEYKVLTIRPSVLGSHPALPAPAPVPEGDVKLIEEGKHPPGQRAGGKGACGIGYQNNSNVPIVYDGLFFLAATDRITSATLRFRVSPGVTVLRESWGKGGTRMLREWDFAANAAVYEATEDQDAPIVHRVSTRAIMRGTRTLNFKRRSVAWFAPVGMTGVASVGLPVNPALLSVKGPGEAATLVRTADWGATANNIYLPGLVGGRYDFGVEAFAQAFAFPVGNWPLFLVTADADYPPCSVPGKRSRASDGHRVCLPS